MKVWFYLLLAYLIPFIGGIYGVDKKELDNYKKQQGINRNNSKNLNF